MSSNELREAIERNISAIADLIVGARINLDLLKGLTTTAEAGAAAEEHSASCATEFYRAAFTSLYAELGAVIDTSDGVLSLPRLFPRLRAMWAGDPVLLTSVDSAENSLETSETLRKVKAWRNKVVAHRTPKVQDKEFYESNKVRLAEIEDAIDELEALLNSLTVNAIHTVYNLASPIPALPEHVQKLFGINAGDT